MTAGQLRLDLLSIASRGQLANVNLDYQMPSLRTGSAIHLIAKPVFGGLHHV